MMHYQNDFDGSDFLLRTYTDSDWATNKGTRKSVSACCLVMNGCLLNSGSRNQGLIALSSAEAETYAATSACGALFLLAGPGTTPQDLRILGVGVGWVGWG